MHFDKECISNEVTNGCLSTLNKTRVELIVKGILRQGLACDYLLVEFEPLPGKMSIMTKVWILSDLGLRVAMGETQPAHLPDPEKLCQLILK